MQEELFGPLLPVLDVAGLDEALERVRTGPSPLAFYLFSSRAASPGRRLAGNCLESVAFNEVIHQAGLQGLQSDGVGESGMGSDHGGAGSLTFSHHRSVLNRPIGLDLPLRYPPYAGKLPRLERLLG